MTSCYFFFVSNKGFLNLSKKIQRLINHLFHERVKIYCSGVNNEMATKKAKAKAKPAAKPAEPKAKGKAKKGKK